MTDIVDQYNSARLTPVPAQMLKDAIDEVVRLRAENARLKEEYEQALQMCMNQARTLKRWSDENEKLRDALIPFAKMAGWLTGNETDPDDLTPLWDANDLPTLGDLRAARAAMEAPND